MEGLNLTTLLPIMMLVGIDSGYITVIVFIITVFPLIQPYIQKFWHRLYKTNSFSVKIYETTGDKHTLTRLDNVTFKAVNWYIDEVNSKNEKITVFHSEIFYASSYINRIVPIFELDNGYCCNIQFKNQLITVFKGVDTPKQLKCQYVTLTSSISVELIKQFVTKCCNKYVEYNQKTNNNNIGSNKILTSKFENMQVSWLTNDVTINKTFDNVFLTKDNQTVLLNSIDSFLQSYELYKKFGIPYKKGFLLYGLPGTGKTSLVYAVARKYGRNIYKIDLAGLTDTSFKAVINKIIPGNIVLFEDIDIYVKLLNRTSNNTSNINNDTNDTTNTTNIINTTNNNKDKDTLTLNSFLEILDGYLYLHNTIVFISTNVVDELDEALIRPGRVDHKLFFSYATKEQISNMYRYFVGNNIPNNLLNSINSNQITTATVINTILLPNLDNPDKIYELLTT